MRISPPHAGHRRRSGRKTRSRSGVLDWRLAIAPLQLDCKPNRPSLPDSKLCRRRFFEVVPHLIELDHDGPTLRLRLLGVGGRELVETRPKSQKLRSAADPKIAPPDA